MLCTVIRAIYLNGTNNIPTKAFLATYLLDFSIFLNNAQVFDFFYRNKKLLC
jgi:hypothetical protein